ncbi:MAG: FAD-dependent oxidoreductase [Clostridiales bacterium]|nr:FAD-dependent oxidoreductase [Clostridiales bacterium]
MGSIWSETAQPPRFPALEKDAKTDILIIGGGMTGILCAYMLEQAGVDYMLAEAGSVCGGITKNTTAKLTFQHGLIYDRLIRSLGEDKARLYLEANWAALEEYRRLCRDIDCDFRQYDSYVYSLDSRRKIENEVSALKRLGAAAEFTTDLPLPFRVAGAARVPGQAQFHPLKFAFAIARGLRIFENTKVLELSPEGAVTGGGMISAKRVIIATHFPVLNKHGGYFLKLYQHRSYVLALKNAPQVNGLYIDEAEGGLSFRNHGNLLLLGGGSHRTGKKGGGWDGLEDFARRNYPGARIVSRWATQDCMSLDGVPYIGQYSGRTPELYTATGFNKWGMSSAMVAAMLLSDRVQGLPSPYASVFSPQRSMLRPQLAINAGESLLGLFTPTAPRCPHMGCALKYNPIEHSWDCPCHGSRFTRDGQLIDNPATDDKRRLQE